MAWHHSWAPALLCWLPSGAFRRRSWPWLCGGPALLPRNTSVVAQATPQPLGGMALPPSRWLFVSPARLLFHTHRPPLHSLSPRTPPLAPPAVCCLPLVTLSPSWTVGPVPGPGASLAQSLRMPTLKLDRSHTPKERVVYGVADVLRPPASGLTHLLSCLSAVFAPSRSLGPGGQRPHPHSWVEGGWVLPPCASHQPNGSE